MIYRALQTIVTTLGFLCLTSMSGTHAHHSSPASNLPGPQVPRVTLSVTPTTVVAGRTVTFTARLSSSYPNLKYRFVFGDGSRTDWQNSPSTTHVYSNSGPFQAYVDIGALENRQVRQLGGSLRQTIQVIQAALGPVRLTANPIPAEPGKAVSFTASAGLRDSNIRYRFSFGDNSPASGWQTSPQATHSYRTAGTYPASVDIGVATNQRIRAAGTARRSIQVVRPPPPATPVSVDLSITPSSVEAGKSVTFNARAVSATPLKYRFIFGDGSTAGRWQDSPQASHRYANAGNYSASVEVAQRARGQLNTVATSRPRQITVSSGAVATASPTPARPGQVSSPTPASNVTGESTAQGAGASPEGLGSTTTAPATSSESDTTWFPWLGDLRNNWWKYLLLALLLLIVGYMAAKWFIAPRPIFHASPDAGASDINAGTNDLTIDSQVLLSPNVSGGQYLVYADEANLVKSVRRENG